MTRRRYWTLDPAAELRYRTDREYADHLRSLLTDAVACRLRVYEPVVGAYLSGGLDSSSVVGITQALGARIETFSMVAPDLPVADESGYIADVVDKWHLTAHRIPIQPVDVDRCRAQVAVRRDVPNLASDLVGERMLARLRERGVRVVLTGVGGDYLFAGSFYHYAEMMRRGDLVGLIRQARADSHLLGADWNASELFMCGLRPLLPRALKDAIRPLSKRFSWVPGVPDWIDPDFATRTQLEERLRLEVPAARRGAFGREYVYAMFLAGWTYLILEAGERLGSEYGLEERHPFFDRRLIEFGLAIPEAQRWRGEQTKFVLRQAMRDLLPEPVYQRRTKGHFSPYTVTALDAFGADFIDHLHIAQSGWVRQDRISDMYREMLGCFAKNDEAYGNWMFPLWMTAGVELWYRSAFVDRAESVN